MTLQGLIELHEPRFAPTYRDFRAGYSMQLIAIRDSCDAWACEKRLASTLLRRLGSARTTLCLAMVQTPRFVNRVHRRLTK